MYNIYIILLNENKDKKDYNFTLKCACVYLDDCISKYANCDYHPVVGWRVILTSLYISVLSEISFIHISHLDHSNHPPLTTILMHDINL